MLIKLGQLSRTLNIGHKPILIYLKSKGHDGLRDSPVTNLTPEQVALVQSNDFGLLKNDIEEHQMVSERKALIDLIDKYRDYLKIRGEFISILEFYKRDHRYNEEFSFTEFDDVLNQLHNNDTQFIRYTDTLGGLFFFEFNEQIFLALISDFSFKCKENIFYDDEWRMQQSRNRENSDKLKRVENSFSKADDPESRIMYLLSKGRGDLEGL